MAHLSSKNQRRDLSGALLSYSGQGLGSATPHITLRTYSKAWPMRGWQRYYGCYWRNIHNMLVLLEELQQRFLKETREMQSCAKRGGKYLVNVSAFFKPSFKTHLGLNNRLHILFRIQIHVFFHSTQLRVAGISPIRKYSIMCR